MHKTFNQTTVVTAGSYDLFHFGHERLLERCKQYGAYLVVLLSTDEFAKRKGKTHVQDYETRKQTLLKTGLVDEVIPETGWITKYDFVLERRPRCCRIIFIMGDDWKGKFDDLNCPVIYLPRTPGISTTELKRKLQ